MSSQPLPLNPDQVKKAAKVLTEAFIDGPMYVQCMPNRTARLKKLPKLFKFLLKYNMKYGDVFVTSPKIEGIIGILPWPSGKMTEWRIIKNGGLKLPFSLGFDFVSREGALNNITKKVHHEQASKPHIYCFLLAVHPNEQGKGFASHLIRHALEICDKRQLAFYLETGKRVNVDIYKHFGLEVVDYYKFEETGIEVWFMIRPVQSHDL